MKWLYATLAVLAIVLLAVTVVILGIDHRFFGLDRLWG